MEEKANTEAQAVDSLVQEVVGQLQAGDPKNLVVIRLVERGVPEEDARQLVENISAELEKVVEEQQFTSNLFAPALLGGLTAAVVGGIIWGLIVILTDYELGIVAWAIGLLAGYGVSMATRGKKGRPLQIIAVASSVLGILIGKYITYYYFTKQFLVAEFGEAFAAEFSVFSFDMIESFFLDIPYIVGYFDLLWVVFAVLTAWKIPQALKGSTV